MFDDQLEPQPSCVTVTVNGAAKGVLVGAALGAVAAIAVGGKGKMLKIVTTSATICGGALGLYEGSSCAKNN